MLLLFGAEAEPCSAQEPTIAVPDFFGVRTRIEQPDLTGIKAIRFMTDDDYPPFHFLGPDGQLTGFNVELARAICETLKLACTIQARRWDTLLNALDDNQGDAVIASLSITPGLREGHAVSLPYYRTPARFVAAAARGEVAISPESLAGKTVGVMAGSAHEAFLQTYFPKTIRRSFNEPDALRKALVAGELEFVFADAIGLAFWLNGTEAHGCCRFVGGPYTESAFFGEGVGIALRKDNVQFEKAIDYALLKLARDGVYATLYLKYFPISFY